MWITGDRTYDLVLLTGLALSVLTAVAGLFMTTPYGRFRGRGLWVPTRVGWLLMEAPAPLTFFAVYATAPRAAEPVALLFAGVWAIHYGNRAVFFPLAMRSRPGSRMYSSVFLSGMIVTVMHGWLYATWIGDLGTHLTLAWLADPRFLVGLPMYAVGLGLILHTEHLLRGLRDAREVPDEGGYKVPYGGGYRWVSSPHYLGEILAWTGLMLATWCPGGLFVWSITLANLVPRALATHRWYRDRFPDYPADRRALVPWLL